MKQKECSRCKIVKPLSQFNKSKRAKDKRKSACKVCVRAASKIRRRSIPGKLTKLYRRQLRSSMERGHPPPDYTLEEFIERFSNDSTYVKLAVAWQVSGYESRLAPSIDRKDPRIPYTKSNIQVMTWGENNSKGHIENKYANAHHVCQYSLQDEYIRTWRSQTDAAKALDGNSSGISICVHKRRDNYLGYIWKDSRICPKCKTNKNVGYFKLNGKACITCTLVKAQQLSNR